MRGFSTASGFPCRGVLHGRGSPRGKARGVEFQNLKGKVRYEGGTLVLDSVSARMYGGEVVLSGHLGLGAPSPDFRMKVAVKDLAAEEILSRKTSLADFLAGPVSLSADIRGGMKDFDDFARTGAGRGAVKIAGGRIKGEEFVRAGAPLEGPQTRKILPAIARRVSRARREGGLVGYVCASHRKNDPAFARVGWAPPAPRGRSPPPATQAGPSSPAGSPRDRPPRPGTSPLRPEHAPTSRGKGGAPHGRRSSGRTR